MTPATDPPSSSFRSRSWAWHPFTAVVPLVMASLGLAVLLDEGRPPGPAVALLMAAGAAWVASVAWMERRAERHPPGDSRAVARAILLGALLLRLPLLFAEPALSTDVWRYLWDGRVATAGHNPYALAPEDTALVPLRDDIWQRLDHRQVPTVYPPLALGVFSIAAATPVPLFAWKLLLTAVELAGCAWLLALARRRGLPAARAAWYAWSPLVAVEVAGMGHVDGLAVAPMVAAVLWLTPRRDGDEPVPHGNTGAGARPGLAANLASALAAAAGALVKLAPLAAVPLWARRAPYPGRYVAAALAACALGLLPMFAPLWANGVGVPPGLTTYGVAWEFNGPLFEPLWRGLEAVDADGAAARLADRAKAATGWHDAINRVYPVLYAQFLAKLLLAVAALWVILTAALGRTWTGRRAPEGEGLEAATGRLFGGLLVCSATVYPWYLLWVLPWAALTRRPAWLAAAALAPVVYLASAPGAGPDAPALFPGLWLAAWGPPALIALLGRLRRSRTPRLSGAAG